MKDNGFLDLIGFKLDYKNKKIILDYINSSFSNEQDIEAALDNLGQESLVPVSTPIYQDGKTSSSKFNEQFRNILIDFIKLFGILDQTASIIDSNNNLTKSFIHKLENGLKEIRNKIDAYRFIANNKEGFTEVKYEPFDDMSSFETYEGNNRLLFNNPKDDSIINNNFIAELNKYNSCLTLRHIGMVQPEAPIPEIVEQVGKYFKIENKLYPLINIVDSDNPDTVWSETILTDKPFEVEMEGEKRGAICKLRIIFEKPMPINNISINPFAKYPIKLVRIDTYQSTEDYLKGKEYAEPLLSEGFSSHFNPRYIDEPVTLEFATRNVQIVEFVINQEHYELEQYSIRESDKNNIQLAEKIYRGKNTILNISDSNAGSILELDYSNRSIIWDYFKDIIDEFLKKLNVGDSKTVIKNIINSIKYIIPELNTRSFNPLDLSQSEEKIISVNKFEYQYGFRSIEPSYKEYTDMGIYVSKPYFFRDNVKEISLVVDEYNPTLYHEDSNMPATSVEYYITSLINPSPMKSLWFPILPENHKYHDENGNKVIRGERLIPFEKENSQFFRAKIRFPAEPDTIFIYKNGELYRKNYEYKEQNGNYIIEFPEEDIGIAINNIYTVNYTVKNGFNPCIINLEEVMTPVSFISEDGTIGEKFTFTANKNQSIKLRYYPYIDRCKLNTSRVVTSGEEHNPFRGQYNPNFSGCYQPIIVEGFGKADYFDGEKISTYIGKIPQDTSGIPYRYKYFEDVDGDGELEEMPEVRKFTPPYFYNKTNYKSKIMSPLQEYDAFEYPVFEYIQNKKDIFFNNVLDDIDEKRKAEVVVKYQYLMEAIRVKIIMYRNVKHNYGLTPVIRSYAIKTKPFRE